MTTQKNVHDAPEGKNLVKPGSTIDPSKPAASQPGAPAQQPATGTWPQGQLTDNEREQSRKHQQEAWDAAATREKDNNPATKPGRMYDRNAPGMHPANQPAPDTRVNKPTRLDLEDVTGNPGHRGVNPDAPANSINGPGVDRSGRFDSINEPGHIDQNYPDRSEGSVKRQQPKAGGQQGAYPEQQNAVGVGSINEPEGSQVIPPGAGQGAGGAAGGIGTEYQTPEIDALEPDEIALGAAATTLSVSGAGFTSQSVISMDGEDQSTTFVSAEEVTTPLDPAQWSAAGVVQVTVANGGYKSEPEELEILEAGPVTASRQSKRTKPKKTKKR